MVGRTIYLLLIIYGRFCERMCTLVYGINVLPEGKAIAVSVFVSERDNIKHPVSSISTFICDENMCFPFKIDWARMRVKRGYV